MTTPRIFHLPFPIFHLLWLLLGVAGNASENPLQVELVAEGTSIQPGQPFRVGLLLKHPPGYHSYWKFPGIVGIPTGIEWDLPEGWKAGEIEWPEPERVFMFEIKAQGYHGEKLLRIKLTPPPELAPGQTVTLKGKARWMCCGRDCNPGYKDVSVQLPVSAEPALPDPRWRALFAASAVATDCADWTTQAVLRSGQIILRIKPVSAAAKERFRRIGEVTFFTEDGLIDANRPESCQTGGGEIVLTQTLSKFAPEPLPEKVVGILQTAAGWLPGGSPRSIRVSVPLEESGKWDVESGK